MISGVIEAEYVGRTGTPSARIYAGLFQHALADVVAEIIVSYP